MEEQIIDTTVADGNTAPQDVEKTFTQDDVNRIVQERLAKERSKQSPPPLSEKEMELAKREEELSRREFEQSARVLLKEHDLPDSILTVLNVSDADGLKNALDILDDIFDYSNKDAAIFYKKEGDSMWRKCRRGDPNMPRFTAPSTGTSSMLGWNDPVREGMGLNKKE